MDEGDSESAVEQVETIFKNNRTKYIQPAAAMIINDWEAGDDIEMYPFTLQCMSEDGDQWLVMFKGGERNLLFDALYLPSFQTARDIVDKLESYLTEERVMREAQEYQAGDSETIAFQ